MNYSYSRSIKSHEADEFLNTYLQRPIAGVFTYFFFYIPITPNAVTLLSTVSGIAGAIILFSPSPSLSVAALLLYLKDILDSADGQLARAKEQYSRRGRFYDSIGDFVVHCTLFAGIGFQLYVSSNDLLLSTGIAAALFISVSLRVTTNVYYQTAYLHRKDRYRNNRLQEKITDEDMQQDRLTLFLQRTFLLLYGWQDSAIAYLDEWLAGTKSEDGIQEQWYADPAALYLLKLFGLGTEFVGITVCLLLFDLTAYIFFSLGIMNVVWCSLLLYRFGLGRKLRAEKKGNYVK